MSAFYEFYRVVGIGMALALLVTAMVFAVRWAKRGGPRVAVLGSALLLLFGLGVTSDPPQQRIEEAREDKGDYDVEDGDPP